MDEFRLQRGYDVPLAGKASPEIRDAAPPALVGVLPGEFLGLKPQVVVRPGDAVKVGSPLFHAKGNEALVGTAPASGTVAAVNRGERRVVTSITITPDGQGAAVEFAKHEPSQLATLDRAATVAQLLASGAFLHFRQRPFNHVADPTAVPRDIFISTFSTAPLAADAALLVAGNEAFFQAGLDVCARLTSGRVHLGIDGRPGHPSSPAFTNAQNVVLHRFAGPHPAGCVGVQLHHVAPIRGRADVVWTIGVSGVIQLGRLFVTGRLGTEALVALAGPAATERRYFRTVAGAQLRSIVAGRLQSGEVRVIAGDVLTGSNQGPDGFLGLGESLITAVPEAITTEFLGWLRPGLDKPSFSRCFLSALRRGAKYMLDTNPHGGDRAMVVSGWYERVLPMDVYLGFLVKRIMAEELEEMEGLGIYELAEEDVAVAEYICPSKLPVQAILRRGLELLHREG